MEHTDAISVGSHHFLSGDHFHVISGEESYHWYGAAQFPGPIEDTIFYSARKAHAYFIKLISQMLPEFITDEEAEESFTEFINLMSTEEYTFDEVRGTQGIYFEPLDMKLVYCNHCIPATSN